MITRKLNTLNQNKLLDVKNKDDRNLGRNTWWRNRVFLSLWSFGRLNEINFASVSLIEISNLVKEW